MTEQARSKRGRKPLPNDARRGIRVASWLTEEEAVELDSLRGNKPRGEWIRLAALDAPIAAPPKINGEAWASLGHALSNLNQIAKKANSGRSIEHAALEGEIIAIRNRLLGIVK